jgi:hypothetical protein
MEPQLEGLFQIVNPADSSEKPEELEVIDDLEGEQQTMLNSDEEHISQLQDSILQVSKGVTEGTDASYQRFCHYKYFFSLEVSNNCLTTLD